MSSGDLAAMGRGREVAGVEEVELGVGQVLQVGAGPGLGEEGSLLAPGHQRRRWCLRRHSCQRGYSATLLW